MCWWWCCGDQKAPCILTLWLACSRNRTSNMLLVQECNINRRWWAAASTERHVEWLFQREQQQESERHNKEHSLKVKSTRFPPHPIHLSTESTWSGVKDLSGAGQWPWAKEVCLRPGVQSSMQVAWTLSPMHKCLWSYFIIINTIGHFSQRALRVLSCFVCLFSLQLVTYEHFGANLLSCLDAKRQNEQNVSPTRLAKHWV